MPLVNHAKREINAKIVYYGPEGAGKAASLRYVYERIRPHLRGQLKSVPVIDSSLLYFDFAPFEHPLFGDYRLRFHIYTLPGRVDNPASWKMVLKGVDGLVIVSDAAPTALQAGRRSLAQLRDILGSYGVALDDVPAVLQLNRSEQSDRTLVESAAGVLGMQGHRVCPASTAGGEGVLESLTVLSRLVIGRVAELDGISGKSGSNPAGAITDSAPPCPETAAHDGELTMQTTALPSGIGEIAVEREEVNVIGNRVEIPLLLSTADGGRRRLRVTVMVSAG